MTLENTKINRTLPLRSIRSNNIKIIEARQNVSASVQLHVLWREIHNWPEKKKKVKKIKADFSQEKGKKPWHEGPLILK